MRRAAYLVASIFVLSACGKGGGQSADTPSASLVAEEVLALAHTTSEGRLELSEWKKTDGMLLPDGRYTADFSLRATFRHPSCMRWMAGGDRSQRKEGFVMMSMLVKPNPGNYYTCAKLGEIAHFDVDGLFPVGTGYSSVYDGRALLLKKESGWHVADAWMYVQRK